jgi:CRISPR/Cas system-associated exonuclease Cas4 (RecB family)
MMKNEKFSKVFTEKSFESFKVGLAGTPDLICIKNDGGIVPIDIKLGTLSRMGIKEEHLLQSIGEAILVEDYFRKRVDYSYLIYFGSNSLVKVGFNDERKEKFIGYKKRIEKISSAPFIPEKSLVDNYRRRVCVGCHVKSACNNIEDLRRIYY